MESRTIRWPGQPHRRRFHLELLERAVLFESGAFPSILCCFCMFLRSLCEGSRLATGFDIRHSPVFDILHHHDVTGCKTL